MYHMRFRFINQTEIINVSSSGAGALSAIIL